MTVLATPAQGSIVGIRLDKWLWACRFYKTRGLAKDMIEGGKVHYNGQRCKPSKVVEPGATIRLAQGSDEKVVVVLALSDKRLAAPLAQQLYQETAESLAERQKRAELRKTNSLENFSMSDALIRFLFQQKHVRGELAYVQQSLNQMLAHHQYPLPVKQLLAELVVATSLLTATLKFEGEIAVQLQGDGPVRFAAVNGTHAQAFRGVVRLQAELTGESFRELVGNGYLVVTITPNQGERYQGIIPLTGDSLTSTLEAYFAQSEQLPTRLYIFTDIQQHNRAAGLMLQVLPVEQEKARQDFADLVVLSDTITAAELLDLEPEVVLHRLFHQESVEVFPAQSISFVCGCSKQKCESALFSLGRAVVAEQLALGGLDMACEYCNASYHFSADDLQLIHDQL
ncbi:UNVERIFIED_CONTAM: hslO [Trichonephila clavipes]